MIVFRPPQVRIEFFDFYEPLPEEPWPAVGCIECSVDGKSGWWVVVYLADGDRLGVGFMGAPGHGPRRSVAKRYVELKVREFLRYHGVRGGA